jgi:hypothetical protein
MKEIEVLSELVNYQSFLDAAYSLAYSPSVISKYVANIENELGIKIFVRGNKSNDLTLTPEGSVLINNIRRINNEYQNMIEMSKQLKGSTENILRVGSPARFGNIYEQEVLASFLLKNANVELEIIKMSASDLLKLLHVGKLDAIFICIHNNTDLDKYFQDLNKNGDLYLKQLSTEREMYVGVSDKHLPQIKDEAKFSTFKDYSFAFPFPKSADENNLHMISSFEQLAQQNGFNLKTVYLGTHDNMLLKLAQEQAIAVTTVNVPAKYEGIKFYRVSDWCSYSNVYFVCLNNNQNKMLKNLKKCILSYLESG